ncbi:MAG TPA: Gfo/Idh/MocA family oxidoreductase [Candidatus Sulfotelmatobacter sp.]|jgi:glucose-fructose oxidoreductase|nr:Gfo/Idh/MocA family oxidoreductase [Candidatus Sulfotelmatobacter sp.]
MKLAFRISIFLLAWALVAIPAPQAAESQPLRVAIAGLVHGHVEGFFSNSLHRPDIRIVGISDPDRSLFDRYASKFALDSALYHADLEEMLRTTKPQAVLVYSSTFDHRKIVELCAKHHIPVMMEKPLAVSLEDARAIERAAREGNIPVLVNYETSWYSSNHAAYELVRAGALGDIRKVVVHDGHQGPKEIGVSAEFLNWLTDPKLNGAGALFDFGCYGADLMTWLMNGEKPLSVTAVTQQIKPDVYPRVDDEATIILTYPKAQAIIQASWNWPFDRKDMEVYGRTGYAITVRRDDIKVRRPGEKEEQLVAAQKLPSPCNDSLTYLRAVVLDGLKPDALSSLQTNLIVTEILDAARQSAATGKTVTLKQ